MFDQTPSEATEVQEVASTEELNAPEDNPAGEMPAEDNNPEAQAENETEGETPANAEDLGVNFSN